MLSTDQHKDLLVAKAHRTSLFGATGFSMILAATALIFAGTNSPPPSALAEQPTNLDTIFNSSVPTFAVEPAGESSDNQAQAALPSYADDLIDLRILESVGAEPSMVVPIAPFPGHAPTRNREPKAGSSEAAFSLYPDAPAEGPTHRITWNETPSGPLRVPAD